MEPKKFAKPIAKKPLAAEQEEQVHADMKFWDELHNDVKSSYNVMDAIAVMSHHSVECARASIMAEFDPFGMSSSIPARMLAYCDEAVEAHGWPPIKLCEMVVSTMGSDGSEEWFRANKAMALMLLEQFMEELRTLSNPEFGFYMDLCSISAVGEPDIAIIKQVVNEFGAYAGNELSVLHKYLEYKLK